ncbi:MAG: serine/threonine protein kinase [Gammaproteobacteria bacterium]|nr:MAG: serine/threonine protein kinase [Gammaproteobacteria bacterium]RKZ77344.1 MAG: serine/threonine protein kinase [Gammaproteobacteria bacterium]
MFPEKILASDWFIGLAISLILLLMAQLNLLQPLEQIAYDWSIQQISRDPGKKVAVIAIDDHSLAQLGELPWSRTVIAKMVDQLAPYSQAIGITLDFSKAQKVPGQIYIEDLMTFYAHSKPLNELYEQLEQLNTLINQVKKVRTRYTKDKRRIKQLYKFYKNSLFIKGLPDTLTTLEDKLQAAHIDQDSDQQLADCFKQANNVILAMPFMLGKLNDIHAPHLPDYLQQHRLKTIRVPFDHPGNSPQPLSGVNAKPPLAIFSNSALGIGYFNPKQANSRQIPLVIKYKKAYYPSLSLLLAAKSFNHEKNDIEVLLGKGIHIEQRRINTDNTLSIRPFFYNKDSLIVDSFTDVLQGRIPAKKYQDKIVLLGMTAQNKTGFQSTPLGEMPSVLVLAHTLTSLLNQDFFQVPHWAIWLQISLFIIIIAYISFLLPLMKARTALMMSTTGMLLIGLGYFTLMNQGLLIPLMLLILLIATGHLSLLIKRAIVAYQDAFRLHPDAVESNRLLGLAFQGQGQLDLAYEKFRRCPPDETILCLLYNLALDYERKRQFRRASAVYRYIISHSAHFRDVELRLERLHCLKKPKLSSNRLNDWQNDELDEKPILGRYQIEKPLGKGAMGRVYLGKDFKLDRLVAIKTLPLSQEFEVDELLEATMRFFREATAAGRLTHSHIVSIYEAGEEQDLAYIAMEFFKGGNLVPYTQPDNLLPIHTVIDIVIIMAEALDYAHSQGVVHRDIKPANIMYNPATSKIKITDFGIARITDSNKTKTGIILGTPSYMSPEQLAGKPLTGCTDLFSLGVMLYQLLTGTLPFKADSLATLMFKIANEPQPDIITVRSDISLCLKRVVDIALRKKVSARYQTGTEFARALRDYNEQGEI